MYYIVLRNANASPTANYMTYRYAGANSGPIQYFQPTNYGWIKAHSTNGGTSWTSRQPQQPTVRLEYSDGTFEGFAFEESGTLGSGNFKVYSNRELGTQFTTPPNACLCAAGVAMSNTTVVGSPTANPYYRLYVGASSPALLAQTHSIPKGQFGSNAWRSAFFGHPVLIGPSTTCTVTLAEETNADADTNYYRLNMIRCKNDVASRALWPFSPRQAYYNGSSWSYVDNIVHPFLLLLDQGADFASMVAAARP